jgi:AcrR family transcriptional regulator
MRQHLNDTLGSMTCSGLLGLAIGRGVSLVTEDTSAGGDSARPTPTEDPKVRAALLLLGQIVGGSLDSEEIAGVPLYNQVKGDVYYFLWSLERVAVAYDLSTFGGHDWYQWGSAWLLGKQTAAGGWLGRYGPGGVDTCFALLFLKRANLSRDLTASLQGQAGDAADETRRRNPRPPDRPTETPPRTGDDAARSGPTTKPSASTGEKSPETLRDALLHTAAAGQRRLIDEYRDHKGPAYTEALGEAIPHLAAEVKAQARDALAERLTRMTTATLQGELESGNAEVRRAAALASAMKEESALIPDLIERLDDPDKAVRRAAAIGLASLTKKNFGPSEDATPEQRKLAIQKWRTWWSEQKR